MLCNLQMPDPCALADLVVEGLVDADLQCGELLALERRIAL